MAASTVWRPESTPEARLIIITRQHPQGGGGGEALRNLFWFIFIINVQYEYNWIRLRQLMYLAKVNQIWTPLPGISALKSVSGGPFLGHLLIWPDAGGGAAGRTLAPGGPEERNRRFAQKPAWNTRESGTVHSVAEFGSDAKCRL